MKNIDFEFKNWGGVIIGVFQGKTDAEYKPRSKGASYNRGRLINGMLRLIL